MAQGRIRRVITLRRLKWVGAVVGVLTLGILFVSMWTTATIESDFRDQTGTIFAGWEITMTKGHITTDWSRSRAILKGESITLIHSFWLYDRANAGRWLAPAYHIEWENGPSVPFPNRTGYVVLGVWPIPLLFAIVTAYLWRTDRRVKPWQCPKCRYDLRGLECGVCPECGQ